MTLPEKFQYAERKVPAQWSFDLFALVEMSEAGGGWDLVVAAPWIKTDRAGIAKIIEILNDTGVLATVDWFLISTVVPLNINDEFVRWLIQTYPAEHDLRSVPTSDFNGHQINRAFIITAKNGRGTELAVAA